MPRTERAAFGTCANVTESNDGFPSFSALRGREAGAWHDFFHRLYPVGWQATAVGGLREEERKEAVSDALRQVASYVHEGRVGSPEELRACVFTVARRRAISRWRAETAQRRDASAKVSLEALDHEAARWADLNPRGLSEIARLLDELLQALDDGTRALIEGYVLHGFSYSELAKRHQLPLGTVGVKIARGLTRLRAGLDTKPNLKKEAALYLRTLLL